MYEGCNKILYVHTIKRSLQRTMNIQVQVQEGIVGQLMCTKPRKLECRKLLPTLSIFLKVMQNIYFDCLACALLFLWTKRKSHKA